MSILYLCIVYELIDQLSEIRKTTFAAIICNNSGKIESIQLHVMHSARKIGNERVGCDSLIKMSLDPWKEYNVSPTAVAVRANNNNNNSSISGERIQ